MNIFFLMLIDIMTKKISAKIKYPVYNYMCQYVGLQKFKEKKYKEKKSVSSTELFNVNF